MLHRLYGVSESDKQTWQKLDLEYIAEVENPKNEITDKVLHADGLNSVKAATQFTLR